MHYLQSVLRGVVLGFVMVMPGMSGGTALIILGIYGRLVFDLANLKLITHIPMVGGMIVGFYLGGITFARLLIYYRDLTAAFFLGVILASLKVILQGRPVLRYDSIIALLAGFSIGFLMAGEPLGSQLEVNPFLLFFGGAAASATMLLPGVSGSAVLVVIGIYDNMLFYLNELNLQALFIFGGTQRDGSFVLPYVFQLFPGIFENS